MNLLDIKFECSRCGQRLVVESSAAGLNTDCPSCCSELEVPLRTSRHLLPGGVAEIDPETHLLRQELAGASLLADERDRQMAILHDKLVHARQEAVEQRAEAEWQAAALVEKTAELAELEENYAALQSALEAESQARAELHEAREITRQFTTAQAAQLSSRENEAAEALALAGGLKDELRGLEGRLGAVEGDLAQARLELEKVPGLEQQITDLREREKEAERLACVCAQLEEESASLKRQLSESADGRELLSLRERLRAAQEEAARVERAAAQAAAEAEKARTALAREQKDREVLRHRCEAAEKRAESHSETATESLRGIVERQKEELLEQYVTVRRLRKAQYGMRMVYGAIVLLLLSAIASVFFWVQHSAVVAEWFK